MQHGPNAISGRIGSVATETPLGDVGGSPSRRDIISLSLVAGATIALPVPVQAQALDRWDLLRLHPTRFIAGLIFDIAIAVVVAVAGDAILVALRQGRSVGYSGDYPSQPPIGETNFRHANYKAAIVTLGVADWREHGRRQISLRLKGSRPEDLKRFEAIRDYLRQHDIRIKLADQTYSHPVPEYLEPDDLFTLDYLRIEREHQRRHYDNLIGETGATVFQKW